MLDVETHKSLDEAPSVPMFSGAKTGKPTQTSALTHAFTEMASSLASAFSKPSTPNSKSNPTASCSTYASPGRLAELRSKYIQ